MIYKNDVIYELARNKEIEPLKEHFYNKFPVKIVLPPERIVKSKLAHNRLPDKPRSISIDFVASVKTPNGTDVWRYAERVTTDKNGNKKYFPKKFKLMDIVRLGENDMEKIFFLLKKSPFCKGGDNQGLRVKFMFEDLVGAAEKRAAERAKKVKINSLLYGDAKVGLPMERIRGLAKAMFISGVEGLTDAQVRNHLYDKVSDNKDGLRTLMDLIDTEKEYDTRLAIQEVIDTGKLVYDPTKRTWSWRVENEKPQPILHVAPGKNAHEELVERYIVDRVFKEDIESLRLTGKKDVGKKGRGKDDDELDNE